MALPKHILGTFGSQLLPTVIRRVSSASFLVFVIVRKKRKERATVRKMSRDVQQGLLVRKMSRDASHRALRIEQAARSDVRKKTPNNENGVSRGTPKRPSRKEKLGLAAVRPSAVRRRSWCNRLPTKWGVSRHPKPEGVVRPWGPSTTYNNPVRSADIHVP